MPEPQTHKVSPGQAHLPRLVGERSAYISSNPADYALVGKSTNGRRTYVSRLNQVARLFQFGNYTEVPWHLLRREHVQYVVKTLSEKNTAPSTINTTLSTLRAVSREAFNLGQLSGEDLTRIRHVKLEKGPPLPSGRHITLREIASLVRVCQEDEDPSGIRDIAIIGLMYFCGLRRVEIANLQVGDFNQSDNSITCISDNRRVRECWPDIGTRDALLDWLSSRGSHLLSVDSPMFTPVRKGGRITSRAISDQSVYNIINKRWQQAGLRPCSPNDFRRSFVTNLLDNNVDVLVTQRLAGHMNAATTLRYDRRKPRAAKPQIDELRLPYSCQYPEVT